ncbi:hypothetical protein ACFL5S_02230 [Fibrobacterota bacterium]
MEKTTEEKIFDRLDEIDISLKQLRRYYFLLSKHLGLVDESGQTRQDAQDKK